MSKVAQKNLVRPLSPFMQYRKGYTMTLSILHRITGIVLTAGFILFVFWLVAAASGSDAYMRARELCNTGIVKLAIALCIFSFFYHLLNGIRHLTWDTGRGFDLKVARLSGYAVALSAVALTVIVLLFLR